MPIDGWIIQIDPTDQGDRTTTCAGRTPPYWTNQSIQMRNQNGALVAYARLGETITIEVTLYRGEASRSLVVVDQIQAWVCYPNVLPPGMFNLNVTVPSLSGEALVLPGGSVTFTGATLGPVALTPWNPTMEDLDATARGDLIGTFADPLGAHVCILANSYGRATFAGGPPGGEAIGFAPAASDPAGIDICTMATAGQRNTMLLTATAQVTFESSRRRPLAGVQFFAAVGPPRRATVEPSVRYVSQGSKIDPSVLPYLESKSFAGQSLKPANKPPPVFGLVRNPVALKHGFFAKVLAEIEEELKDLAEDLVSLATGRPLPASRMPQPSLKVTTTAAGVYPLAFVAQFDADERAGNVHVFDIVQEDPDTKREGGIRVAVVVR
jgi:hypothetical protein